MKTIGLLGGMSWESTLHDYRLVNESVKRRLGGLHSAKVALHSVDFAEIEALQRAEAWEEAGAMLADAARALERHGAHFMVLCTNTMHRVAEQLEGAVTLPLLHIADPTGAALVGSGASRVGLLGTRFTMEQRFFSDRLADRFGLEVVVPPAPGRELVHRVIYDELSLFDTTALHAEAAVDEALAPT